MQISSATHATSPWYDNGAYSRIATQEKSATLQATSAISYENQGDSVQLSVTGSIEYHEATYTAEGFVMSVSQPQDVIDNSGQNLVQDLYNQYFEIIRRRIEYLLRSLFNNDESPDSSSPLSGTLGIDQGLYGYTSYSESTLSVYREFSLDANIMLPDYLSPEKTAERIINFALSFYDGGDRGAYVDMVKGAVMKGYLQAKEALGGYLPAIADKTISLIMEALDTFADSSTVNLTA